MTTLEQLNLSQPLTDVYTAMETDLMMAIARQLAKDGEISATSEWRLKKLAEAGALSKETVKIIASYTGIQSDLLTETIESAAMGVTDKLEPALQAVARDGLISEVTSTPISAGMKNVVRSFRTQAKTDLNLVNTVMQYKAKSSYTNLVNKIYNEANKQELLSTLGKHTLSVASGATSRQEAVRNCIKEFSQKGIPAFVDKAGREWSPEAYINMDIRTTVNNTAHAAQDACCDKYGIDLFQVSSHMGARPKCAPYQGRLVSRSNQSGIAHDGDGNPIPFIPLSETSYGEPDGLFGINCHHKKYPFIDGVNFQRYFPYDEEENAQRYKEFQQQRYLERRVRETSRQVDMLNEIGDTEGAKEAHRKLTQQRKAYRDYSDSHGLAQHNDRLTVTRVRKGDKEKKALSADKVFPIKGASVKFSKVSQEKPMTKALKKEISYEYDRFTETFGQIDTISSIGAMTYKGGTDYGGYNPNSREITLLGAGGEKGRAFLAKVAKEQKKAGEWSTASPMHVARHEMGHALQLHMSINDKYFDRRLKEIRVIYETVYDEAELDINRLTNPTEADIIKARAKRLSSYGLVSLEEFISESVAEYQNGSPRATAMSVVEILLKGYE